MIKKYHHSRPIIHNLSSTIHDPFNKGFTLIEILVAATILALLSALAIANFSTANKSSRDARRKADLEQVRTALELYRSQNGYYPTGSGWVVLSPTLDVLVTGGYIAELPKDPFPATHADYKAYKYKATDGAGSYYYGYCLEADLEASTPASNPCTPEATYNYSVRHP